MSRSSNKITDDDLNAVILKLQTLLPQLNQPPNGSVYPLSVYYNYYFLLCSLSCFTYIRSLQKEVDDLSERLSQCLDSMDISSFDAEILRNLLQQ
ncbi:hypothetical protein PTKIN_Ptkin05aG0168500 [Pterospermum kingtungense]